MCLSHCRDAEEARGRRFSSCARPPGPMRRFGTAPKSRVKATLGLSRVPRAPRSSAVELKGQTADSCVAHVHTTDFRAQTSLVVKDGLWSQMAQFKS